MLEQKLTNTDGLNPLFGEQLLWFDGQSYQLTPTSSLEAYDIRALKKHWYVYLTGDVAEDTKEIERKSFLKGLSLDECLCDLGIIDDDDIIYEDEIKVYALVDDDGNIVTLTTEEEERWKAFTSRKQGRRQQMPNGNTEGSSTAGMVAGMDKSDLPF